jgi:hypothetical protein
VAKYLIAWLGLAVLAVINGALREIGYKKAVGELAAHQISTFTLIILSGIYIWFVIAKWPPRAGGQAILIGVVWLGMTLAFEFLAGHYLFGNPWSKILHDYNLFAGRIWILIPIWTVAAPYVFYLLRRRP